MPNPLLHTISHVRRLPWREGLCQITLEQGIICRLAPQNHGQQDGEGVLNAEGGLAIPPFVEPHIYLDTTQTAGDLHWNDSGTLFEGIARWAERKAILTHEDVKTPPRYVIRHGQVIAETPSSPSRLYLAQPETVDFR